MAGPWLAAVIAAMISGATPVTLSLQKFMPFPSDLLLRRDPERPEQPTACHVDDQHLIATIAAAEPQDQALISRGGLHDLAACRHRQVDGSERWPCCAYRGWSSAVHAIDNRHHDDDQPDHDQHAHDDDERHEGLHSTRVGIGGLHHSTWSWVTMTASETARRYEVTAAPADGDARLDRLLAQHLPHLSRSRVKALIIAGHVAADGATIAD